MTHLNRKVREFVLRAGGLRVLRAVAPPGVRVLLYHRFPASCRTLLALECRYMRRHYKPVSLSDIDEWLYLGRPLPSNSLAVTVDDGHRDFFDVAYPIFRDHGIPVTVFLTTGFLDGDCWLWTDQVAHMFRLTRRKIVEIPFADGARRLSVESESDRSKAIDLVKVAAKRMPHAVRTVFVRRDLPRALGVTIPDGAPAEYAPLLWDQVRGMSRNAIYFGAHTKTHPILSSIDSVQDLRQEIRDSRSRIEQELNLPVPHFSYPNGTSIDIDRRTVEEVKAAGFRCAVIAERGVNQKSTDPYLLYRIPVGPLSAPAQFGRDVLRN